MCRVSIVVPVFKVGKYIENSMKSVCRQTFKDFEVILVDNNTPDDSIERAERILKESRIQYRVVNQIIQGLPAARNLGIREAEGEWIISIDPDDTVAPNFLSSLIDQAEVWNSKVVFSNYGDAVLEDLHIFTEAEEEIEAIQLKQEEALYLLLNRSIPLMVSNMFFKRDFFVEKKLWFDEDVILGADLILVWRLLLNIDSIVCIKNVLYNHFVREDSLMTAPSAMKINSNLNGYRRILPEISAIISKEFSSWVYSREVFALIRTCCIHGTKQVFLVNSKCFYTQDVYNQLKSFPDKKVQIMNYIIHASPLSYYYINRLFKDPDSKIWRKIVGRIHT